VIQVFARHPVAANLAMVMMILAGIAALRTMPSMLDPPMQYPLVFVEIEWRGAGAEDVEELVTTPIEQQLRSLNGLREVQSRSTIGYSRILARFELDADMTIALDQVKQRVDGIRNLPTGIETPRVYRAEDLEPVATVLVRGEGTVTDLVPLVRRFERELLDSGIGGVQYQGLPEEEIAIMVSGRRLQALGLTLDDVAAEVDRTSRNVPAGAVGRGQGLKQLRSLDQLRDPVAFESLALREGDRIVRLGDVAEIERRPMDGQPLVYSGGDPAIEMTLWRATADDAWLANEILDAWLADTRPTLPAGVSLTVYNDVWDLIGAQLGMIYRNALSGLLLVVAVLFLFLNGRVGFWVMLGIPVSFLLALAIFWGAFGYGISIIALIGFIMALGIVVDDAIVVGEDTVTHFENGASPEEAAVRGARRMWVPVATSSLTTLAAFIPLLIMGGTLGAAVLALPTVLLCVIIASLFECFLVLPGHLRETLHKVRPPAAGSFRARFDAAFTRFRDERFMPVVHAALRAPAITLCAALGGVMLAVALIAGNHVRLNMVTGFSIESLEANVEFAASATDEDKARFLVHLQDTLDAVDSGTGQRNILGVMARRNFAWIDDERARGEQYASVEAPYAFEEARTLDPEAFLARWRERIVQPPYVERLSVVVDGGQNGGDADIELILSGNDIAALKAGSADLRAVLDAIPGVYNVVDNLPYGRDQVIFDLQPRGRALGLTGEAVGAQLRSAYSGSRVQIFNENEAELEVRVMLPDEERADLSQLARFPIRTATGEFVPLGSVATLSNRRGIDTLRHFDGRRAVIVRAHVDPERNNAMQILSDVEEERLPAILAAHDLEYGLGGRSRENQIILQTMALGGVLTLILIYLILAWVFASYLWPLAIMMAIPFGFTGAVFGHWATGWDVGAMSLLAFFSLTGIVVNDSIVLISFLKHEIEDGVPLREALSRAVRARFRAVLLTSLTTIAGLAPLIFENSTMSFYVAPIAITVCFGLALATLLVLIVIPALILLLEDGRDRAVGFLRARRDAWLAAPGTDGPGTRAMATAAVAATTHHRTEENEK
jgi:multidrug efflux pump subunit AcrB